MGNEPMKLEVREEDDGFGLYLDGKRLEYIEEYNIKSSANGCTAELSIKMLVKYPVSQENSLSFDWEDNHVIREVPRENGKKDRVILCGNHW